MCRIGQAERCRINGCQYEKVIGYHCHGEKIKKIKSLTYDESVNGIKPNPVKKTPAKTKEYREDDFYGRPKPKHTERRQKIWDNAKGICYLCDKPVSLEWFTIDHVIPKAKGGKGNLENLRPTHWMCNHEKGDKLTTKQ